MVVVVVVLQQSAFRAFVRKARGPRVVAFDLDSPLRPFPPFNAASIHFKCF